MKSCETRTNIFAKCIILLTCTPRIVYSVPEKRLLRHMSFVPNAKAQGAGKTSVETTQSFQFFFSFFLFFFSISFFFFLQL
uniref:Uncharacterized protein n=1 Tax=Nelumbo nucifera TaxID=4432 RepID=A0A822Y363_NELNU|nr:TPA_asm: hypothetical protein HUJ06_025531 [Nelumbo nucifera]